MPPPRAAFITGRAPVRNGMGIVGMPHESKGLAASEVTIAEVLSEAGYATAFYGKGHLGDIEESYLHNQGFDEALFTPMNQISSLWNEQATAANAILGMHPEMSPPDPYKMDSPGLIPVGWVMAIEGKKGELGKEFCGTSNECYDKIDDESEKRTIAFMRKNAKAKKPFFVTYQPNWLNFLKPQPVKSSENGGKTDFTEGGVRVPAIAWWPGMIESDQLVGDIIHVTDLFTTFARIGEATQFVPTDRIIDGIDQTELLLEGDTHGRRDYVHIYQGHTLAATVKGRYKRHWIGLGDGASSGAGASYYDLYQDPQEKNPQMVPLIHFEGQFNAMRERHELMKEVYPDHDNAHGVPYTGLSNARPETLEIAKRLKREKAAMPESIQKLME